MTKGKKRSREETEDPNPRPVKRQETDDEVQKMDLEFQQINDECVKRAIIRINNKLFANLDVLDKIQKEVQEREKSTSKNKPDISNNNNATVPSDPLSRDEESAASEKSSQTAKTTKKRGKQPTKQPYQIEARYPTGKKEMLTPQVHKMPPVESIPTSTTWAPVSKNYPVADDREKRFVPYYSDEEERDDTDLDTLYDKRFLNLEDHDCDNILEGYILKYGTKDQNQILPDDKMQYLTDIMECDTPADIRKYLVEKTNYVKLFCQNNSNKPFDPREYDGTLATFFCRRCYTTVCPYHNTFDKEFHHFNQNEKKPKIHDRVTKPCGKDCFANEESSANGDNNAKNVWTERDVIMFNKSKIIFATSCQMQKVIRTKTCKQIYDRLIKKGLVNSSFNDEDDENENETAKQHSKKKLTRINRSRKDGQKFDAAYSPCSHTGFPCGPDVFCPCFQNGTYCEKYCSCSVDCERKFPGCNCSSVKNPCIKTAGSNCLCVQEMRECDPDICNCKCDCYNALALAEKQKKVSVRKSKVAGWGLFADTKIKTGEFVAEYKGDLISLDESERRGWIYDERKVNFLFGLHNSGFVVDATRKGNKMKFANHSPTPNINSGIESVLGELRIVMRAGRDIEPDEELFIDYGYSKDYFQRIGDSEKNKASRKQYVKKASVKETTENSEENSASEGTKNNKKKPVYKNVGEEEDEEDTKKKNKILPVIKMPPKKIQFMQNATKLQTNADHVTLSQSNANNSKQESNPNPNKSLTQPKVNANNVTINNASHAVQVSDRRPSLDNNGENRNNGQQRVELSQSQSNNNSGNNTNQKQSTKPASKPANNNNANNNSQISQEKPASLESSEEISVDEIMTNNSEATSVRSATKNSANEETVTKKIKQRKVTAPKLHYKKGPPVVDLDSEPTVKRRSAAPVECISSGEEDTVVEHGVVDVEDQEVEYMGKFVDVQSVDSD